MHICTMMAHVQSRTLSLMVVPACQRASSRPSNAARSCARRDRARNALCCLQTLKNGTLTHPRCPFRKSYASIFCRRQRIELGHWRIMFGHFFLVIRTSTMPVPLAPHVTLGCDEQSHLESIVRAHSTPQALVFRCRLILRTAAPARPSNLQVAQDLHCNRHTVGRWRRRYLAQGL